ncbi:unnamed protein product, partial [Nesidiocoris tenuis]
MFMITLQRLINQIRLDPIEKRVRNSGFAAIECFSGKRFRVGWKIFEFGLSR